MFLFPPKEITIVEQCSECFAHPLLRFFVCKCLDAKTSLRILTGTTQKPTLTDNGGSSTEAASSWLPPGLCDDIEILSMLDLDRLPELQPGSSKSSKNENVVMIDDLSLLIMRFGLYEVCRFLKTTSRFAIVIALAHSELIHEDDLRRLRYIAVQWHELSVDKSSTVVCSSTFKERTSKLVEQVQELVQITPDYRQCVLRPASKQAKSIANAHFETIPQEKNEPTRSVKIATESPSAKPIESLTFRLGLSEKESSAKQLVRLPYMQAQERQPVGSDSAKVYYVPDEADDIDEEDPDDDLDI